VAGRHRETKIAETHRAIEQVAKPKSKQLPKPEKEWPKGTRLSPTLTDREQLSDKKLRKKW
jgi:hypothetical protein